MQRICLPLLALAFLLTGLANPTRAQVACPLSLVLALDVSSSVDDREYDLQKTGVAGALLSPEVVESVVGENGIWLAVYEWSGKFNQRLVLDWTFVHTLAGLQAAANRIASTSRSSNEFPTSMGYALAYAHNLFRRAPERCLRKVLDISGDGVNNDGFPPGSAWRAFDFRDVTVNGLVIKGAEPDPELYYRTRVIRGPGAFVEVAARFEDYERAMSRKLLREIGRNNLVFLQ